MRGPYKAKPTPGSFADLITRYRQSPRVIGWAPSTGRKNDKILGQFMAANGRAMVADLRRGDFIAMRDSMARTPSEANNWAKVIRGMLDYAVDIEMIPFNPVARVKRLRVPNRDGFRTWRDDEIAAFEAHWARGSLPRRTLTLALCTGAARADLVRLGWANVNGDRIAYRRQKTGAVIDIPILPALAEELTQIPRTQMTFLETKDGRVRSPVALATMMGEWCVAAGIGGKDATGHHLSLHGLRKAGARRAAEEGADVWSLMAFYGWEDPRQASTYVKKYDRARAADALAEKIGNISGPKTNVTRLKTRVKST